MLLYAGQELQQAGCSTTDRLLQQEQASHQTGQAMAAARLLLAGRRLAKGRILKARQGRAASGFCMFVAAFRCINAVLVDRYIERFGRKRKNIFSGHFYGYLRLKS